VVSQWVGRTEVSLRCCDSCPEAGEDLHLAGVCGNQVERVHRARLTDAVDAADALLEPHRIPRQLEVDDQAASPMQVEPLRSRVGGKKKRRGGTREFAQRRGAFLATEAAVEEDRRHGNAVTAG